MNFLQGTVDGAAGNAITVDLGDGTQIVAPVSANGTQAGEKVTLGLRPEHLIEGGGGDAEFKGRVIAVEHLGGETFIYLERAAGEPLTVKSAGESRTKVDDLLPVGVPANACYLFDAEGKAFSRPAAA